MAKQTVLLEKMSISQENLSELVSKEYLEEENPEEEEVDEKDKPKE